jgi:hypothetical protein
LSKKKFKMMIQSKSGVSVRGKFGAGNTYRVQYNSPPH